MPVATSFTRYTSPSQPAPSRDTTAYLPARIRRWVKSNEVISDFLRAITIHRLIVGRELPSESHAGAYVEVSNQYARATNGCSNIVL